MHKVRAFTQLSIEERVSIDILLKQHFSFTAIAKALNRSVSTISREFSRNASPIKKNYQAHLAQQLTVQRHKGKPKHMVFTEAMKLFIVQQLHFSRLSPELISVKGRQLDAHFISQEWIYQWIWKMKFSHALADRPYVYLYEYLRNAARKRKRGNKHNNRGNIIDRRFIDERSSQVNKRTAIGNLECDIMLGKDRKPGLLVVLERKTRKTWIRHLKSRDAGYVMSKVKDICKKCRQVKTVTFDNDQSFAQHYKLHPLGIKTFFTHPYSAQEKGSVENRIGLIRMFFPKKTEFAKVSPKKVKQIQTLINNRPIRMFNYKSANEVYQKI